MGHSSPPNSRSIYIPVLRHCKVPVAVRGRWKIYVHCSIHVRKLPKGKILRQNSLPNASCTTCQPIDSLKRMAANGQLSSKRRTHARLSTTNFFQSRQSIADTHSTLGIGSLRDLVYNANCRFRSACLQIQWSVAKAT